MATDGLEVQALLAEDKFSSAKELIGAQVQDNLARSSSAEELTGIKTKELLVPSSSSEELVVTKTEEVLVTSSSSSESANLKQASEIESLNQIIATQKQLSITKDSLSEIIDSLADDPSLFTQASIMWGELPLWKKVAGGVVLSCSLAIGSGIVGSGVVMASYSFGSLLLDDHHSHDVASTERLKVVMLNLAQVLQGTITSLDIIQKKLAIELDKFKLENSQLTSSVSNLSSQIHALTMQIGLFIATDKFLVGQKEALEKAAISLKDSVESQAEQIEVNQKNLNDVTKDYKRNQELLSLEVIKLRQVRMAMDSQIKRVNVVSTTLEKAVQTLSDSASKEKNDKALLKQKIEALFAQPEARLNETAASSSASKEKNDKALLKQKVEALIPQSEARLNEAAEQVGETQKQFNAAVMEFKEHRERQKAIFSEYGKQIDRLKVGDDYIKRLNLVGNDDLASLSGIERNQMQGLLGNSLYKGQKQSTDGVVGHAPIMVQ
jgi:hypothetical protein